ncbi:MAG: hypothetical protein ACE5J9_00320 [Methanosarcinales archaeon]
MKEFEDIFHLKKTLKNFLIFPPPIWPKISNTIKRGTTLYPNPDITLRTNINGIGRCIERNHFIENFLVDTL